MAKFFQKHKWKRADDSCKLFIGNPGDDNGFSPMDVV